MRLLWQVITPQGGLPRFPAVHRIFYYIFILQNRLIKSKLFCFQEVSNAVDHNFKDFAANEH